MNTHFFPVDPVFMEPECGPLVTILPTLRGEVLLGDRLSRSRTCIFHWADVLLEEHINLVCQRIIIRMYWDPSPSAIHAGPR